jgi:hypothetical protein
MENVVCQSVRPCICEIWIPEIKNFTSAKDCTVWLYIEKVENRYKNTMWNINNQDKFMSVNENTV